MKQHDELLEFAGMKDDSKYNIHNALVGLFISLLVNANSQITNLNMKVSEQPPFITLNPKLVKNKRLLAAYNVFYKYIQDLKSGVEKELPRQLMVVYKLSVNSKSVMDNAFNHERYKLSSPDKVKAGECFH
mgnify:CR=1 FL=1